MNESSFMFFVSLIVLLLIPTSWGWINFDLDGISRESDCALCSKKKNTAIK